MHRTLAVLVVIVAAAMLTPVDGGAASEVGGGSATLAPLDCGSRRIPAGYDATCHALTVPEDHGDPTAPDVVLPVAVLTPTGTSPSAPPLLYLTGGPGGAALSGMAGRVERAGFPTDRSIVFFDQRGTGGAVPSMDCPGRDDALRTSYVDDDPWPDRLAAIDAAIVACHADLVAAGIDPTAYTTEASALDARALRRALGIERWDVYGISYGGELALTIARDDADGVRSLVLDSPYLAQPTAPDRAIALAARSLADLDDWCSEQPACTSSGGISGHLATVAAGLDAAPASATVRSGGADVSIRFRGDELVAA